jgi:integrase
MVWLFGGSGGEEESGQHTGLQELQELLDQTERNRITSKTRGGYESKLKNFLAWYRTNVEAGEIRGTCPTLQELGPRLQSEEQLWEVVMLYLTKRYRIDGLKAASLRGDVSAFAFCVKEEGEQLPLQFKNRLASFLTSCSKEDARKREAGEVDGRIGRSPLSFGDYDKLCCKLLQDEELEALLLVTLTWSSMNRVNESLALSWQNVQIDDDHLLLSVQKTKCDQTGERIKRVRVYGNPLQPHLCPLTAIGLFLLKYGANTNNIFGGGLDSSRSKYCKMIQRLLDKDRTGTHSLRKGAASFASGSSTNSPGVFSICNRGGWSTGVMNRYIRDDTSGDCYLGRILTGLDRDSSDFASLPPHFPGEAETSEALTTFLTEQFGSSCMLQPPVVQLCLASVCWHKDKLSVISSGYATLIPSLPQPQTGIRSFYMRGTGVPPDISLHCVIRELQQRQDSTLDFLQSYRDETVKWRESLLDRVADTIEKHWELNGQVTPAHMNQVISTSLNDHLNTLLVGVNKILDERLPAAVVEEPAENDQRPEAGQFAFRRGHEGLRSIPVGFSLSPRWTLHEILCHWKRPMVFNGDPVPSLCDLKPDDFVHHPSRATQVSLLRDIKLIMSHVLNQLTTPQLETHLTSN